LVTVLLRSVRQLQSPNRRAYDSTYHDYHNWDRDEDQRYRRYLAERHRNYRDYWRLKKQQQSDYWPCGYAERRPGEPE
jgi:hypothetical protein